MSLKKEEWNVNELKFGENGLIPVVAQDYESGEVLILAYMNEEAVNKTFETGYAHYYSRSKKTVTKYGETLGNTQKLIVAFLDRDNDTLLIKVKQSGKADMEGNSFTCFPKQIKGEYKEIGGEMLGRLQRIVGEYKKNPEDGAYTSFLFARGVDRIAKKVGEEAVEFVIASKNADKDGVVNEAADLLYHTMVLLSAKGVKLSEVCSELCKRNR
ncbi:MAG: bifunctional phosphoribosyl-AMP cyclohydrolase/phosphoribosyl-ATP diphosphatase HisIE [Clostridia bacterium]|nr:bifunctional phosphoribosyl-AMP cyclohydrolase/phosphoribosyl-ATP diphosphatase HisIE [Clostridia bacterium]